MITATRITRALGILGVAGFLAHATTSLATSGATYQDPAAPEPVPAASALDAAPLPTAPEPIDDLPPVPDEPLPTPTPAPAPKPEEPPAAKIEAAPTPKPETPAPAEPAALKDLPPPPDEPALDLDAPPTASSPKQDLPPAASIEAAPAASLDPLPDEAPNPRPATRKPAPRWEPAIDDAPETEAEVDRPAARESRGIPASPLATSDDPDAQARTFLERNRREAEGQLKALRDEAAQLKARLARVEAGIRRWEALADALDRGARDQPRPQPQPAAASRAPRSTHPAVQYGVPVPTSEGVIIQSRPLTRSDFVPVPRPR